MTEQIRKPRRPPRKLWRTTEDAFVRKAYKTSMSADEIGAQIGRSGRAVNQYAVAIGIKREDDWRSKRAAYMRAAK